MKLKAALPYDREVWARDCLRRFLPQAPVPVVSDIGAGFAWMRNPVEEAGARWQGFDVVPKVDGVMPWNLDDPAPTNVAQPGLVVLLEVLEHLPNPALGLRHIADHLLPGGYLVLCTPNPRWSRSRLYELQHGVPFGFTPRHLVEGHLFTPWPHIVVHLLEEVGLEVLEYVTIHGKTPWPALSPTLGYAKVLALALACRLIEWRDPTAQGYSYGLVLRKRPPGKAG